MKTAESILKESILKDGVWTEKDYEEFKDHDKSRFEIFLQAIRQAQIEAIEECAEVATAYRNGPFCKVDKESILQLKNQVI